MTTTTPLSTTMLPGLAGLADRYDGFILDLWGVIHDGNTAYPWAAATLAELRRAGKATVLLSNAPRRAHALIAGMERMGIPRDLYGEVVSSGEAVRHELEVRRDPFYAALGRRCHHLGPERDRNIFEGLDLDLVADPADADFVLNTGPWEFEETVADYEDRLRLFAGRGMPMVCANPDHMVIREGRPVVCAGALAARYETLGGRVSYRGKPDPAIYALCLDLLGIADHRRVAVVGDAIETDIAGATKAGLDSILVTGGLHASELGVTYGESADPHRVASLLSRFNLSPVAAIPAFAW
ncbi:MAG: TIGR01459 family HAD-type hydrolase [Alphaproteobacteria bacterium]